MIKKIHIVSKTVLFQKLFYSIYLKVTLLNILQNYFGTLFRFSLVCLNGGISIFVVLEALRLEFLKNTLLTKT